MELRESLSAWMSRRFGVSLDPMREILPLVGSKEGIAHLAFGYVGPRDATVVPDPGYQPYRGGTLLAGGTPHLVPLRPETEFVLLDRSESRVELMKRVSRVLDLPNVEVRAGDIAGWVDQVDGIVSRGSLSPERAGLVFPRHLAPGGRAVIGGSWASPPDVTGFDLLEVPGTVLDQRVWLLIMPLQ